MKTVVIAVGILLMFGYLVALLTVEGRLEDMRRTGAPPMPSWNWGRFRYLTDLANLRPEAEPLVRRYKALWFAWPAVLFAVLGYLALS